MTGAVARVAPVFSSVAAIGGALLVGGLFLEARGKDAIGAYRLMVERGLGSSFGLTEIAIKAAPLLLVGAGLLIALKAGVWNIGVDGQFLIGALAAGVVAPGLSESLPNAAVLLLAALGGALGGLAWATIPAVLRVRFGLNEIITTLVMTSVAINLSAWLVKGPLKDPAVVPPQTRLLAKPERLPDIPGTDVHVGLIAGVVAVGVVAVLFGATVPGFRLWVLGQNPRAARHAGMDVGRLTAGALLASGALAGLAGANDVLGVRGLVQANWNPGYGFAGFALVYLARLRPLGVIPVAFFFSFLLLGGDLMSRAAEIPTQFVEVLEGLMLVFFAVAVALERGRWPLRRRTPAVEGAPAPLPAQASGETA